jgi:peptidoglycan/xylan/chitin deacetylase (PgdA/CDA1 family)
MPALILMYHDLAESVTDVAPGHRPYVLAPAVFRRQMEHAAGSELQSLTVRDWCAKGTPGRALVVTFDDGHVSNHALTLPILVECGLRATFFITAGSVGEGDTMNWTEIRELHRAGMEIGSHTLTHRPPTTLSDRELRYELSESRRVLEDGLGAPVTSISSPTGFFNPRMRDIAREVGYQALCFGRAGLARKNGDPFSLNRIAVKRGLNDQQFQAMLAFDRVTLWSMRSRQWIRENVRGHMGVEYYLRLRRLLLRNS